MGIVAAGRVKLPGTMAATNQSDGISNVLVRRATVAQAQSLTVMINNAFEPDRVLFKPGDTAYRVTPDGKRGAW